MVIVFFNTLDFPWYNAVSDVSNMW